MSELTTRGESPGVHASTRAEPGTGADAQKRPLRFRFRARLTAGVGRRRSTLDGQRQTGDLGVSSVVRDEAGRILLIKTAKAGWELPGGRVEQGEDFITALIREVREETGCEIDVGRLTGVTSNTAAPRLTVFTFLCQHIMGAPSPGDDALDAGWFAPDTAVSLVTHPVEQVRLTDALGDGQGVIYRAYRRLPSADPQRDRYEIAAPAPLLTTTGCTELPTKALRSHSAHCGSIWHSRGRL